MNSDTMQSVAIPMLGLVLATVFPAFLISVFAVGLVKRFAVTLGLLDEPNARKVHTVPIPLGGGLGIWLGVVGTCSCCGVRCLLAKLATHRIHWHPMVDGDPKCYLDCHADQFV